MLPVVLVVAQLEDPPKERELVLSLFVLPHLNVRWLSKVGAASKLCQSGRCSQFAI